jgi:hypothetical protein
MTTSSGLPGIEIRNNKRPEIMRTEKTMPAIAAARGVFKCALIKSASCFINFLRKIFLAIALFEAEQFLKDKMKKPGDPATATVRFGECSTS